MAPSPIRATSAAKLVMISSLVLHSPMRRIVRERAIRKYSRVQLPLDLRDRKSSLLAPRRMAFVGLQAYYAALEAEASSAKKLGLTLEEYQEQRAAAAIATTAQQNVDNNARAAAAPVPAAPAPNALEEAPPLAGVSPSSLDAKVERARELYESRGLAAANFIANQVRGGGFTVAQLKEGGFSADDVRSFGYSIKDLKKGKFKASELRQAGVSASELKSGGFSARRLKQAKFSAKELRRAKFTATEVLEAGYTPDECKLGGFSAAELIVGGCAPRSLKEVFGLADLKTAGCDPKELLEAGWTAKDLKAAGFSWYELAIWCGTPLGELRQQGFTSAQEVVRCFEEHPAEMRDAGYSVGDLLEAGCELWQLARTGAYTVAEILEVRPDADVPMLRDAGFRVAAFDKSGFGLAELLKAGFDVEEIRDAGLFSAKEIDAVLNPKASMKKGGRKKR